MKLKVRVEERVKMQENLKNKKQWFNGQKEFSSVKILPPYLKNR